MDRSRIQPGVEIAFIVEQAKLSGGGRSAGGLMFIFNLGMAFLFVAGTRNVLGETVVALLWLVGNQVFGLMVMLGLRRDYIVQRAEERQAGKL
jgi:hypothetical protein